MRPVQTFLFTFPVGAAFSSRSDVTLCHQLFINIVREVTVRDTSIAKYY